MTDPYDLHEDPVGPNHGRAAGYQGDDDEPSWGKTRHLDRTLVTAFDTFHLDNPGVSFIDAWEAGAVAHRGVVQEDEYLDPALVQNEIEYALGFTYEQIKTAYSKGRPTADARAIRDEIDAALLGLSRGGGNMSVLARWLPMSESTMDRALARARAKQPLPMIPHGRVKVSTACFKCGSEDGVLRNRETRSARETFDPRTGRSWSMIALCPTCFAKKHEAAGNPEYWQFRKTGRPSPGHVNSNWAIRAMYERRQEERYA